MHRRRYSSHGKLLLHLSDETVVIRDHQCHTGLQSSDVIYCISVSRPRRRDYRNNVTIQQRMNPFLYSERDIRKLCFNLCRSQRRLSTLTKHFLPPLACVGVGRGDDPWVSFSCCVTFQTIQIQLYGLPVFYNNKNDILALCLEK